MTGSRPGQQLFERASAGSPHHRSLFCDGFGGLLERDLYKGLLHSPHSHSHSHSQRLSPYLGRKSRKSSQASSAASACAAAGPTATCKKKTLRQQYSHKHTHKQQTKKHSVLPHHHHYQMPSLQSIRTLKKEAFRSLNTQIVHSQLAFVNRLAYYDSQPFSLFDQDDDTTMRGTIDDADSEDSGAHAYSDSDFDDLLDSMCDVSLSQDEYEQVYLFESHQALLDHEKQQAQDLSDSQPERRDHHKHRLQHPQQHEQRHTQDQQCSNTDSDDSEADLLVFDPQYREAAIGDLF